MKKLTKSIFAVLVVFHPDKESFLNNIKAYISAVDHIVVYCNSEGISSLFKGFEQMDKVTLIGEGDGNVGIAKALNEGIRWGWKRGYKYVMTMDQDSYWSEINSYFDFIVNDLTARNAIYSPKIITFSDKPLEHKQDYTIQSGTVYKMELFQSIGLFPEKYFIDFVDIEMCLRASRYSWRLVYTEQGLMKHQIGYLKPIKGTKYMAENYPPLRYFYICRNGIWIWKQYNHPDFSLMKLLRTALFIRAKHILLGENRKIQKLMAIFHGLIAGLVTKPSLAGCEPLKVGLYE